MDKKEKIYDEQIAHKLLEIADICKKHDMSIFASVEYKPGYFGTTRMFGKKHNIFDCYEAIRQCICGNGIDIDKFLRWVIKEAHKTGHSSIYLHLLGVKVRLYEQTRTKA
jgi:hypothetical protein